MKQIFIYTLLATLLGSTHLMAQPTKGQYYGTLRSINIRQQYTSLENQFTQLPNVRRFADIRMHLEAGKMVSDRTSLGVGLIAGYSFEENSGVFRSAPQLGLSLFGRKWFPLYKSVLAHVDLQSSYAYQWSWAGMTSNSHNIDLGLMPGVSWFFHPKWSLEGRVSGVQMRYRSYESAIPVGNEGRNFDLNYNVNPLTMQFAISRFF